MEANINERWAAFTTWFARSGLGQEALAQRVGISQSAISRILAHCPRRDGRAFKQLCIYASMEGRGASTATADVRPIVDSILASAIWEVWNGTPEQARAIADVIRAVGVVAKVGSAYG